MSLLSYDLEPSDTLPGPRLRAVVDIAFPCNLSCPGCARGRQRGRPARGALLAVADRLASLVDETGAAATSAVLFGGEPMLDLDAVVGASSRVRDACARAGCGYEGAVITNALLLDGYAARRLARSGIGTVQVTLRSAPRGPDGMHVSIDVQRVARMVRNLREARNEVDVLLRAEVSGDDDLREALTVVRVLEREGVLAPPRAATVLIGPPATYAVQARAIFASRPPRDTTCVTRCP
jgi:MoaA/NifB/PqqE/SkfB family radical SAM enzyme